MISLAKEKIRKRIRRRLARLTLAERRVRSEAICRQLFALSEFQQAGCVMFYLAKRDEVDTIPMIQRAIQSGKRVCVPVTDVRAKQIIPCEIRDLDHDCAPGPYGIQEPRKGKRRPVSISQIHLIVVPGLAFDHAGHRLGRGAGYYDRFLKCCPPSIPRIGLAFDFQLVKRLPFLSHDVGVTRVVSA